MKLRIFTILALFITVTVMPLRAEMVFLTDGSIINGEIIISVDKSITLKDDYNRLHEIQRTNIIRIRPSEKIGKVYIQKRNGEGIYAYIVDENKFFHILRTELYNPNEFTIEKSDVIEILDFVPDNLNGVSESNQIYLTWSKPRASVLSYKIYYSTVANGKYKLDGTTTDNSYIIKNISSDKTYYIIVTSIGMDKSESPPSNELIIQAKVVIPPPPALSPPKNLMKTLTSDDKIGLTWDAAESASTGIKEYRIFTYGLNNNIREDGKTEKTAYTLFQYPKKIRKISVKAVDDSGLESEEAIIKNDITDSFKSAFSIKPMFLHPIGRVKEVADFGFGGSIGFSYYEFISYNTTLSFETGYLRWAKNDEQFKRNMYMVPITLSIGQRYNFTESLSLSALIGGGAIFVTKNCYLLIENEKKYNNYNTLFTGAINFDYIFSENCSLFIGGGFYSIHVRKDGKNKFRYFAENHIGLSFRLQ